MTHITDQAECAGLDPELFHPAGRNVAGRRKAKAICAVCPVQTECAALARARNEQFGVWGGESPEDRRYRR